MQKDRVSSRLGRQRQPKVAVAGLAVIAALAAPLTGLVIAAGTAAADVTAFGGGDSYGALVTPLLPETPSVTQPPGGSATALPVNVPGVLTTGVLSATSTNSGAATLGTPTGTVSSSASVANANVLPLASTLTVGAVSTSCVSSVTGSVGQTTITNLQVAGSAVALPVTIPADFGLTVPGLASVVLNHQVVTNSLGSTSIAVDGLFVQLLGGVISINLAHSSCAVSGPDVNAAPTVTAVSPATGATAGGNSVTVTGTDFTGTTAVDFGANPATNVVVNSPTQLTATAPAGAGTVDVTVTNAGGTSPTVPADRYSYLTLPDVVSITPVSGPTAGGTLVTITGTGLSDATTVDFGAVPATTFLCATDTTCTATTPPQAAGPVSVTVTTPGGVSPSSPGSDYTYIAPFPYHAVTPYRIADTRAGSGEPYSGQTVPAGGSLNIQVLGTGTGTDGVPANATVAVLNVTEAGSTSSGYFTVFPAGDALPLASTLNTVAGNNVPNLVEVAIGAAGMVTVHNSAGNANVVVDVEGYVGPAGLLDGTSGLFNGLTPARIADTRTGSGQPYAGQHLTTGGVQNVQVLGRGGVPATGVSAVVLNVTATNTTQQSYYTVYPAGTARPLASNVNMARGLNSSNRVIVPVDPVTGQISVFNYAGTPDLVIDVNGWYSSVTGGVGDIYSGFSPQRIADTRANSNEPYAGDTLHSGALGQPGGTLTVQVAGSGGVPTMTSAAPPTSVVLNVTETDATGPSYLTVYPAGQAKPLASDLNFQKGETKANLVVVKLGPTGAISLYNYAGQTNVIIDVVGFYSAPLIP